MRDVTWRPTRRAPAKKELPRQLGLLIALVGVNIGVVIYHGNPLAQIPDHESAAQPAAAPETHIATPATAAGIEAVVTDEIELAPFDPTLGLRTPGPVQRVERVLLSSGQTAAGALVEAGVPAGDVSGALASLVSVVDFRRLHAGDELKVRLDGDGGLVSLDILRGLLDQSRAERVDDGQSWRGAKLDIPVDVVETAVSGQVTSSLWTALVDDAGESAELVHAVVDVFAWEIDFYSQVFPGDTFRILVEKRYAEGQLVGYGDLLAAEIVTAGAAHRGFIHRPERADGKVAVATYYDADGKSLRKQLLKAPLEYGHITSGFGRRRHPILGYTRAHNGIDYGVPIGTPVWSVGDGRVMKAGWHGGFGRLIEVRHANGWTSHYAHLSRIGVEVGQRVQQKEVIGAVGSTGLSTGPHLHYGLKKNGVYVNPLLQKFEPGKSLRGTELAAFRTEVATLTARLDAIHIAMAGRQ